MMIQGQMHVQHSSFEDSEDLDHLVTTKPTSQNHYRHHDNIQHEVLDSSEDDGYMVTHSGVSVTSDSDYKAPVPTSQLYASLPRRENKPYNRKSRKNKGSSAVEGNIEMNTNNLIADEENTIATRDVTLSKSHSKQVSPEALAAIAAAKEAAEHMMKNSENSVMSPPTNSSSTQTQLLVDGNTSRRKKSKSDKKKRDKKQKKEKKSKKSKRPNQDEEIS